MTQVSKYRLDKDAERELFSKFWKSMSSLRDADTVSSFFSDFLSDTEELMLAKRFAIAVLLHRGRRPIDIKHVLHVSNSATGAVSAWLKNAKPKTIETLERVIKESNWQEFIDSIEAMLDDVHPIYGTNWSSVGKERWKRKMVRTLRQSVR